MRPPQDFSITATYVGEVRGGVPFTCAVLGEVPPHENGAKRVAVRRWTPEGMFERWMAGRVGE